MPQEINGTHQLLRNGDIASMEKEKGELHQVKKW